MGLIRRLNDRIVERLREVAGDDEVRRAVVTGRHLALDLSGGRSDTLELAQLTRATAVRVDVHAGTEAALLLMFAQPPRLVRVPESCEGWPQVCGALDGLGQSTPFSVWYPRLLADRRLDAIDIWNAPSS